MWTVSQALRQAAYPPRRSKWEWAWRNYIEPEDDIAPGSIQPVILTNDAGEREITRMRWGFKLPDRHLFTARSEAIDRVQFWKDSFQLRRCIVPADAIFEWAEVPRGKKPKYEVTIPGREPFGIAGVWKLWNNHRTNMTEPTFAVLTGEPNELIEPIHHRMTTILEPHEYTEYLSQVRKVLWIRSPLGFCLM